MKVVLWIGSWKPRQWQKHMGAGGPRCKKIAPVGSFPVLGHGHKRAGPSADKACRKVSSCGWEKISPSRVFPSAQPWCKRASPGVLGYAGKPGATGVRGLVPVTTSHVREPETVGLREPDLGGDPGSAREARLPYGERGCNGDPAPHASLNSGAGHPHQYSCLENSTDREPGRLQSMGLQRIGCN